MIASIIIKLIKKTATVVICIKLLNKCFEPVKVIYVYNTLLRNYQIIIKEN